MSKKLFISYRSRDAAKVDAIVKRLRSAKHEDGTDRYHPWQDKKNIPSGRDWWEAILDAIEDCDVFVFHISEEALKSDICKTELNYAQDLNKPVIPIVLDGEYEHDPHTDTYKMDSMDRIPARLRDYRTQLLFYDGASFIHKFDQAVIEFEKDLRRWKRLPAKRPSDPSSNSGDGNDDIRLYSVACESARRLELDTARSVFTKLIHHPLRNFHVEANEWIEILEDYKQLMNLDQISTRYKLRAEWIKYQGKFPKFFLDEELYEGGIFDPCDLKKKITTSTGSLLRTTEMLSALPTILETEPPTPEDTMAMPVKMSEPPAQTTIPSLLDRLPSLNHEQATSHPLRTIFLKREKGLLTSSQIMPVPFAWITIPTGRVRLIGRKNSAVKQDSTLMVLTFDIGKYPVTNAQYAVFMTDHGYQNPDWWTEAGWAEQQKRKWMEPRYWHKPQWNAANQPVVGVSWYECVAFCRWLSHKTGEKIMLPTELQWQRASQGDQSFVYPWGNEWRSGFCNNSVKTPSPQRTTAVQMYEEKGGSPFKVVDMVGNVWEWCLTAYETGRTLLEGTDLRALRGGSWEDTFTEHLQTSYRNSFNPGGFADTVGFRLARVHNGD